MTPIRTDAELLIRATAARWRVIDVPGIGRRLIGPHAVFPAEQKEHSHIIAYLSHRTQAVHALLNPTENTPCPDPSPVTPTPCNA